MGEERDDDGAVREEEATSAPDERAGGGPDSERSELPAAANLDVARARRDLWAEGSRSRRLLLAACLYVGCVVVYALLAGRERLLTHTPYNHFAHLADAWLHGRQDLPSGPPTYAGNNDFALFDGKTYISFPPFPAMLMLPLVWLSGSPENFRDGQFVVWLAGIGPAALFLALEKLRRTGRSMRRESENVVLTLLFAFGTVYCFSAVQGTVWFAGHVVGVGLAGLFLLCALDAERPAWAGVCVGLMFLTRVTTVLTALLFVLEAVRVCSERGLPAEGSLVERIERTWADVDKRALAQKLAAFAVPVALALALASWMNYSRFGDASPAAFGHEHLTVGWKARIMKWGLFSYHYFAKNLGIALTSLPYIPPPGARGGAAAPFQINGHGLALWFTTPAYLWLLWPRRVSFLYGALALSAAGPLVVNLFYQNSGWYQFGYRFSNDYAVLLFAMLAVGGRPFGAMFRGAAAWAVAWNVFGALSFERAQYTHYYFRDGSQSIVYQPD